MNSKSRICLYLIALSYLLIELLKIWESQYLGTNGRLPFYYILPFLPVVLGLIINLLNVNREKNQ